MKFMLLSIYSGFLNVKNDAYKTMTKILFKKVITKIPRLARVKREKYVECTADKKFYLVCQDYSSSQF